MFKSDHPSICQFESFKAFPNIRHFTTTRHGGCSTGAFATFNLGNYSGDTKECIDTNRKVLCDWIGLQPDQLFVPHQMHGTETAVIDQHFLNADQEQQTILLEGKDALLTSCKNICIAVSTADCVPVLLYDASKQITAAIHAGWRGTCRQIVGSVARMMIGDYGCRPAEIHAAIGPSIDPDAFEVGNEVYEAFYDNGFDMEAIAYIHPFTGKYHIIAIEFIMYYTHLPRTNLKCQIR